MDNSESKKLPIIILVEDDSNDVELCTIALQQSGVPHKLMVAEDGMRGLELIQTAQESEDVPHLVLTDLKMPRLNGIEMLEKIRTNPKMNKIPVVLFSSSLEMVDVESAYEHDVNAYVCKPTRFAEFLTAVKNIAEFWVLRNETVT